MKEHSKYTLPEKRHVEEILEFGDKIGEDENILIHCSAGISRSTAVAMLILVHRGMSPVDAMNEVF